MSVRELVVLGTASQVPTRTRAHNGYLLRFDGVGVVVDPGEGTQRQLTLAGARIGSVRHVLITHAHGDHCLGLPGVLQRLSLEGVAGPVHVRFPAAATPYIERLRDATLYHDHTEVVLHPDGPGVVWEGPGPFRIRAVELSHGPAEHPVPTLGWRLEEPDGRRLDRARLQRAGVPPRARSELVASGHVTVDGRRVELREVSDPRPGQVVAVVMDTRDSDGAREAAAGADLLVIEATFLEADRSLAEEVGHLTAAQAAAIGRDVGARRVVLTHFSQRYSDTAGHLAEARAAAPDLDVVVAADLDRIPFPPRVGRG
ncbi:MBL fold metallo-hydrolase [Nitriliruptor alkaliphilus]|uniref:MBL fold metallo-hydrolase n=1 Tax=Nitriliruptor alkaliphilus TaxID=427918 RepID=UPI000699095E|nr:MBL fold metallo-hydrolase [Nitriliruptor alkaliphilus]